MRLICITLLLLNLGYCGYMQLPVEPKSAPRQVTVESAGVPLVALVREAPTAPGQAWRATSGQSAEDVLATPIIESMPIANPASIETGVWPGTDNPGCEALGPFRDLFHGQEAVKQFTALGARVYLKAIDSQSRDRSYRVILPAAKSGRDAFRRLRELETQAIDSYVIMQGKDALAISLGVFATRAAALQLQAKIQNRGYAPVISEIIKYDRQFWMFAQQHNRLQFSAAVLASVDVIAPNVRLQKKQCPEPEN